MSEENVEIVKRGLEAANRDDWDAAVASWDPHIVIRSDPSWPEWGCYGREAAVMFLKEAAEAWGTQVEIDEIRDLGDRLLIPSGYGIHAHFSAVEGARLITEIVTFGHS